MSWVFDASPYEGKGRLVHLALADHANDDGDCYPGTTGVARKAKASAEYVRRIVNDMIVRGFAEELEQGGGRGKTKHLRLLGPWSETSNSVAPTPAKPPTPAVETSHSDRPDTSYGNHQEPSL